MKVKEWLWLLPAFGASIGVANAQSSVTLYGILDSGIQYANVGGTVTTRMDSGAVLASRWGMIGQEDIGGGTSVIFKLEDGLNLSNGTSLQNGALFGREAWVGLRGSFGQIQGGVTYTALHTTLVTYSLGGVDTLAWGNAANNFVFVPMLRTSNSIRYVSPSFHGVLFRATYALGSNGSPSLPRTLGNTVSVGTNYSVGAFSADVDFMTQVYSNTPTINSGSTTSTGNFVIAAAKYVFKLATVSAIFQAHRGGSHSGTAAGYSDRNNEFYEISTLVPLGFGRLMLSFGQYKDSAWNRYNATSYGVRYDYLLSKRTALYAGVATVRNGSAAGFTVNGAAGAGVPVGKAGQNVNAAIVGMSHSF